MSESVSPENLVNAISQKQRKQFHPILVTDVVGFIDVLVIFWGQKVKGQGHNRRRYKRQRKPVEFHVVLFYTSHQFGSQNFFCVMTAKQTTSISKLSVNISLGLCSLSVWRCVNKCIVYLKLESATGWPLTACLLDCRFRGAVTAGESIYLSGVSGRSRAVQHTWDRLTSGVGGRDAGREGQGLQYCMHCKCNAKTKSQGYYYYYDRHHRHRHLIDTSSMHSIHWTSLFTINGRMQF